MLLDNLTSVKPKYPKYECHFQICYTSEPGMLACMKSIDHHRFTVAKNATVDLLHVPVFEMLSAFWK